MQSLEALIHAERRGSRLKGAADLLRLLVAVVCVDDAHDAGHHDEESCYGGNDGAHFAD